MMEKLKITFFDGTNKRRMAIVHNFPGLDVEMSSEQLYKMGRTLIGAALDIQLLQELKQLIITGQSPLAKRMVQKGMTTMELLISSGLTKREIHERIMNADLPRVTLSQITGHRSEGHIPGKTTDRSHNAEPGARQPR